MARELSMLEHVTELIMDDSGLTDQEALALMNRLKGLVEKSLPEVKKEWFELKKEAKKTLAHPKQAKSKKSRAGVFSGTGKKKDLIEKLIQRQKQRQHIQSLNRNFETEAGIPTVDVEIKKSNPNRDSRNLSPILQSKKESKVEQG